MTDQATVRGRGLFPSVTRGSTVNVDAWRSAERTAGVIGTCRLCGAYLVPDRTRDGEHSRIEWFVARCLGCEQECAAPGGRLLRRSGRASEQPIYDD